MKSILELYNLAYSKTENIIPSQPVNFKLEKDSKQQSYSIEPSKFHNALKSK